MSLLNFVCWIVGYEFLEKEKGCKDLELRWWTTTTTTRVWWKRTKRNCLEMKMMHYSINFLPLIIIMLSCCNNWPSYFLQQKWRKYRTIIRWAAQASVGGIVILCLLWQEDYEDVVDNTSKLKVVAAAVRRDKRDRIREDAIEEEPL